MCEDRKDLCEAQCEGVEDDDYCLDECDWDFEACESYLNIGWRV
jgi:hypothetical protein